MDAPERKALNLPTAPQDLEAGRARNPPKQLQLRTHPCPCEDQRLCEALNRQSLCSCGKGSSCVCHVRLPARLSWLLLLAPGTGGGLSCSESQECQQTSLSRWALFLPVASKASQLFLALQHLLWSLETLPKPASKFAQREGSKRAFVCEPEAGQGARREARGRRTSLRGHALRWERESTREWVFTDSKGLVKGDLFLTRAKSALGNSHDWHMFCLSFVCHCLD